MILRPFQYVACRSVAELVDQMSHLGEEAYLIAGGTVVVPMMKHRIIEPDRLVSLEEIDELHEITDDLTHLRIGAAASHRDVHRSAAVRANAPLLAEACGRVASPVIRSMGTLGGNIAYAESASDPGSVLLALDATVVLAGPGGERRVAIREFYVGLYETVLASDEVIVAIEVPTSRESDEFSYFKWAPRAHEDKPLVGLAVVLSREEGRCTRAQIALGGVCETPVLLEDASTSLVGRPFDAVSIAEAAAAAASEVEPLDDLQASASYRRDMVAVWVRRVLEAMEARPS